MYNSVNHDIMNKYATLAYKVQLVGMNEAPEMAVKTLEELISVSDVLYGYAGIYQRAGNQQRSGMRGSFRNMTDNALMDNCLISNPREAGTRGY